MANHLRRQIKERIATTLTGLSTTGSRVYQTRFYDIETGVNLPGLFIYADSESIDFYSLDRKQERILQIIIEGGSTGTSNLDDTLDGIIKEVEVAMEGDLTINDLALDSYLDEVTISISGEGAQPLGIIKMIYVVKYQTQEGSPDAAL